MQWLHIQKFYKTPKKIKVYKKRSNLIPQEESYRLILKELNIDKVEGQTRVLKNSLYPSFYLTKKPRSKTGTGVQREHSTNQKQREYAL